MTDITLTQDQIQTLWSEIGAIKNATGDLLIVCDAFDTCGLGTLTYRVGKAREEAKFAAEAIARVLHDASGVGLSEAQRQAMGEGA